MDFVFSRKAEEPHVRNPDSTDTTLLFWSGSKPGFCLVRRKKTTDTKRGPFLNFYFYLMSTGSKNINMTHTAGVIRGNFLGGICGKRDVGAIWKNANFFLICKWFFKFFLRSLGHPEIPLILLVPHRIKP